MGTGVTPETLAQVLCPGKEALTDAHNNRGVAHKVRRHAQSMAICADEVSSTTVGLLPHQGHLERLS